MFTERHGVPVVNPAPDLQSTCIGVRLFSSAPRSGHPDFLSVVEKWDTREGEIHRSGKLHFAVVTQELAEHPILIVVERNGAY